MGEVKTGLAVPIGVDDDVAHRSEFRHVHLDPGCLKSAVEIIGSDHLEVNQFLSLGSLLTQESRISWLRELSAPHDPAFALGPLAGCEVCDDAVIQQ